MASYKDGGARKSSRKQQQQQNQFPNLPATDVEPIPLSINREQLDIADPLSTNQQSAPNGQQFSTAEITSTFTAGTNPVEETQQSNLTADGLNFAIPPATTSHSPNPPTNYLQRFNWHDESPIETDEDQIAQHLITSQPQFPLTDERQ